MAISDVTEFTGQLPQEGDQATFSDRSGALLAWLVQGAMPEFNAAVAGLNTALNGEASTLDALQAVQDAVDALASNNEFTNALKTKLNALDESIASKAEAEAGTNSTKRMTALRVQQAIDTIPASVSIGVGQTWQDVKASRASSTVYQNTTGVPIEVMFEANNDNLNEVYVSSDNASWIKLTIVNSYQATSFIVPGGHYYKIVGAGIERWAELR